MADYWGRFVPSVTNRAPAGDWEHFRNAENPARQLKLRAKERHGKFFLPPLPDQRKGLGYNSEVRLFPEADASAMMLIWLCREEPDPDEAPDEAWHLTDRYGLIRTSWSSIIDPIDETPDESGEVIREPRLDDHETDEHSVVDFETVQPEELWRPPSLDELAERKVILIGDKRPLTAGAYSERQVEHYAPRGIRKPCPECGVAPNVVTLRCKCK